MVFKKSALLKKGEKIKKMNISKIVVVVVGFNLIKTSIENTKIIVKRKSK